MTTRNRHERRDVFVGRNSDGDRFFIDFAYSDLYPVLLSGSCIRYRCREADNAGQMLYRLPEVVKFAPGWDAEKLEEIRQVWDQYQLERDVPEEVAEKVRNWVNG